MGTTQDDNVHIMVEQGLKIHLEQRFGLFCLQPPCFDRFHQPGRRLGDNGQAAGEPLHQGGETVPGKGQGCSQNSNPLFLCVRRPVSLRAPPRQRGPREKHPQGAQSRLGSCIAGDDNHFAAAGKEKAGDGKGPFPDEVRGFSPYWQ